MRKRRVATAAVVAAMVGVLGFSVPAFAAGGYGSVKVTKNEAEKTITIGNEAITRTFSWQSNKLKPGKIKNKLDKNGGGFTPAEGSEEFVIQPMTPADRTEPADGLLTSIMPGANCTKVEVTSTMNEGGVKPENAIDGDNGTYWCSNLNQSGVQNENIVICLGSKKTVKSVEYVARYDSNAHYGCTGRIDSYIIEYWDGAKWVKAKEGSWQYTDSDGTQTETFDSAVTTDKIRLKATASHYPNENNKNKAMNVAEIDVKDESGKSLIVREQNPQKWTIESTSVHTTDGGGINALIDGNFQTHFHSAYGNQNVQGTVDKLPVDVTIDRGEAGKNASFQTVGYAGRKEGENTNGNVKHFAVYASNDKGKLFEDGNKKGDFKVDYTGAYDSNGPKMVYFGLDKAVTDARYVGVRFLEGTGGNIVAGSELALYDGQFTTVVNRDKGAIKASDLTVKDCTETKVDGGTMLTFTFNPFTFGKDAAATVEQKVVMYDGDHFMRKWIELKTTDTEARVKFIDGERLKVAEGAKTWTAPRDKGGVVAMEMDKSVLGQPVYINGMFFGCEFPEADTQIMDEVARSRYWTGKNFADFERDGQLTKDGEFVSWETVCGATHSDGSDMNVIQTDFFAYITSISKPSDFRIQYNSWFDNMMFIDDENIIESFKAVDKELSETGVRPLESYVVDDGWNAYGPDADWYTKGNVEEKKGRSGDTPNATNFWAFNDKFPNELTPSSSLVNKLGSNFGVWIGPRGGYNYYGELADIVSREIDGAAKGSKAGGSIDVADQRYVDAFGDMAVDWMKKWDVNYWKWDGFADGGQYGAFTQGEDHAQFNEAHQHMEGGPHHFYHVTDLWEKWIVLFDRVWETASAEQIEDLWVSLTCYVNPSPWFLQWSNSVWIQCTLDRGDVSNGVLTDKMNTMLTYRDACYYDFLKNHEFQFPLANLYNHDPVYGKEGTGITADSMNGEQFRNYLYMMGTRGTAFWELYYSDSLFNDEKYLVNADFLEWEEDNFDMLRNAKMIGSGSPASQVKLGGIDSGGTYSTYGFAGFNNEGNEGIISMRNPGTTDMELKFTVGAGIGCTSEGTYHVVRDHVYTEKGKEAATAPATVKYGQEISVTLQPGETQIWHLSKEGDTVAPKLSKLYTENNTTMRVQASEHVYNAEFEVCVDGKKIELGKDAIKAYADLKTFDITLPVAPIDGVTVEVKATAGADAAGNALAGAKIDRTFNTDNIVGQVSNPKCPNLATQAGSIKGTNGFAAVATVNSAAPGTVLISQGSEWELGVNADGYAYFTVGDVTATSQTKVAGATSIAGVRENNGMLKVYVGGEIDGNGYDAAKSVEHNVNAAPIKVNNKGVVAKATVYDRSLGYDEIPAAPLAELVETVKALKDKVTEKSWTDNNIDTLLEAAKAALTGNDPAVQQQAYDALLEGYGKLVPGLGAPEQESLALGKTPTAGWLPGSSQNPSDAINSARDINRVTDGKLFDGDYAIFGKDGASEPAYLQIDLGEGANIDSVTLWRYKDYTYADTALVVSNDPKFSEIKAEDVLYYTHSNENEKDVFKLGVDAKDGTLYQETEEGKELFKSNGSSIKARYIRLYGNGKMDNGAATQGDNHIYELQVMGTRDGYLGDPYGVDALNALIQRGDAAMKDKADYTDESIKALEKPLADAQALSKKVHEQIEAQKFDVTYGEFNAVRDALQVALGCLEMRPVEPGPGPDHQPTYVTVTFDDMVDGTANKEVKVLKGSKVAKPEDPVREGYTFAGWYADEALTEAYDFGSPVNEDTTLYAKWTEDGGSEQPNPPVDPEDPNKPGDPGKPEDPNKPGKPEDPNKPVDPNRPGKPGADNKPGKPGLPQTGDNTLFMVGGIMVVAVAALVAGFYLKRHRS